MLLLSIPYLYTQKIEKGVENIPYSSQPEALPKKISLPPPVLFDHFLSFFFSFLEGLKKFNDKRFFTSGFLCVESTFTISVPRWSKMNFLFAFYTRKRKGSCSRHEMRPIWHWDQLSLSSSGTKKVYFSPLFLSSYR